MNFYVLSLFPEFIDNSTSFSILKRAKEKGIIKLLSFHIRSFAKNKHKTTDLPPYGGGAGMVLKPEPIFSAVRKIQREYKLNKKNAKIILLSASGKLFTQEAANKLSKIKNIILICGHYEGVDERVSNFLCDEEISIGNYVLSGGEYPALVMIDSISRLLPNVLENKNSKEEESFSSNLLEYPQYTRPENFEGKKVPKVLLSGNHEEINRYRKQKSIEKTAKNRPDMITPPPAQHPHL